MASPAINALRVRRQSYLKQLPHLKKLRKLQSRLSHERRRADRVEVRASQLRRRMDEMQQPFEAPAQSAMWRQPGRPQAEPIPTGVLCELRIVNIVSHMEFRHLPLTHKLLELQRQAMDHDLLCHMRQQGFIRLEERQLQNGDRMTTARIVVGRYDTDEGATNGSD